MFWQIFLFELKYRAKRPAAYIYFLLFFAFAFFSFASGELPRVEKEFYNTPAILTVYSAMTTIFMMLVSSSIMGTPLYRDIEHNTKDYYLSYPITPAGYFWGRFLGSFFFVAIVGSAVFWGAITGSLTGPLLGWSEKGNYLPFHAYHYIYAYLIIVLPNLFFTASLFFGLVAVFRNVKVIYSSGIFLFLGYIISNFFLHNTRNATVIGLSDPFAFNTLRFIMNPLTVEVLNKTPIPLTGLLLENRILWTSVGAVILLFTWLRFSFERFFAGSVSKTAAKQSSKTAGISVQGPVPVAPLSGLPIARHIRFTGSYYRRTLYTLTRIEILNIIRDNYFWIILSGGLSFLTFLFWHSFRPYDVEDYQRTVTFLRIYFDIFGFFLFFIISFYTGETVHREKITRYAFINDALPPPDWVLSAAKILSLLALALFLASIPLLLGIPIQLLKGFHHFNFPAYFIGMFCISLPGLIEMVFFSYMVQVLVNNKFAGYGIGIGIWVLLSLGNALGYFTYLPLLYGHVPEISLSDMDLAGHMLKPIFWFHSYWMTAGGCLLMIAALYFNRGLYSGFRERTKLARERFRLPLRVLSFFLLAVFLVIGAYIYYNVSILNNYLTLGERRERAAIAEKTMKRFENLPYPTVIRMRMQADLFPRSEEERTKTIITLKNNTAGPIDTLLLDGDNLESYTLSWNGRVLGYECPLFYPRGKFNFLRAARDSGDYRLYRLPSPLLPGDTAVAELSTLVAFRGFQNGLYGATLLRNGTLFNGALPGVGYDADEELANNDKRKEYGLTPKIVKTIPHDDSISRYLTDIGPVSGATPLDITVSTEGDQWAVGPGTLEKEWLEGGRHYFHYTVPAPGTYPPFAIISARYARMTEEVPNAGGQPVRVSLYYHPAHNANLDRLMAANKDGIRYMSEHYGPYPFRDFSLAETSDYAPNAAAIPGITIFSEHYGWNAHFTDSSQTDYLYYEASEKLANQWWNFQTAPNHTAGSRVISAGLPKYLSIILMEKKYGPQRTSRIRNGERWQYLYGRRRDSRGETALLYADDWNKWALKTGIVLYGLKELIGEDSLNNALREFHDQYAFLSGGPYPGSEDLYRILQKHTPDSVRYYLTDTWEKVTLYDNKMLSVERTKNKTGTEDYTVTLHFDINKLYMDSANREQAATGIRDFISIGIYGTDGKLLYTERSRLTEGAHTIDRIVHGKPVYASLDPEGIVIDRNPDDNRKAFEKETAIPSDQ